MPSNQQPQHFQELAKDNSEQKKDKVVVQENIAESEKHKVQDGTNANKSAAATKPAEGEPPQSSVLVSDTYNNDRIEDIAASFKNKKLNEIVGEMPESVLLFDKDYYSTKGWTQVQFAIYNKNIRAVRYFVEYEQVNRRLSTRKKDLGKDETVYHAEIFPLLLAIHNQDDQMLDYIWSMNELWEYEHLTLVLQIIFTRTFWVKGVEILLGSEATQDIYNSLSYGEKKQFMIELYYRYLHQSPEQIKKTIRKASVQRPYSIIVMNFLMAEETDNVNNHLIKKCCEHITTEDYAKMKYESGPGFMKEWNYTLDNFQKREDDGSKVIRTVTKKIKSLEKDLSKSTYLKSSEAYAKALKNLDRNAEDGEYEEVKKMVIELDIRTLSRSKTSEQVLLSNMILVETFWNAFHIALFKGHLKIVQFFLEDCRIDAASVGRLSSSKFDSIQKRDIDYESFPLYICILQNDIKSFEYLWVSHGYFWNLQHWLACISLIEEKEHDMFIKCLMSSKTSHEIFMFQNFDNKIKTIDFFLNKDRLYKDQYASYLKERPYKWSYYVQKAMDADEIGKSEAKELSAIGKTIRESEMEIPDNPRLDHVKTFIKKMTKLDEEEHQFKAFKSVTSMLVKLPQYEKYKAEDDDKLLTDVDEGEGEDEVSSKDSDSDSEELSDSDGDIVFPSSAEFCQAAESGNLKKIQATTKHKEFVDILKMVGYEKEVTIGEDEHNTELWNALLFAINKNQLEIVKYLINDVNVNLRLCLTNPEKRDDEYDEADPLVIEPEDELYGVQIAVMNRHLEMFEYLWEANFRVWNEQHLDELLKNIVEIEWIEGLKSFMEARATHEIFISLPFDKRQEAFESIVSVMDSEMDDDDDERKEYMLEVFTQSPY